METVEEEVYENKRPLKLSKDNNPIVRINKKRRVISNEAITRLNLLLNNLYNNLLLIIVEGIFDNISLESQTDGIYGKNDCQLHAGPIKILFSDNVQKTKFWDYCDDIVMLLTMSFRGTIRYFLQTNQTGQPEGVITLETQLMINDESIDVKILVNIIIHSNKIIGKLQKTGFVRLMWKADEEPSLEEKGDMISMM